MSLLAASAMRMLKAFRIPHCDSIASLSGGDQLLTHDPSKLLNFVRRTVGCLSQLHCITSLWCYISSHAIPTVTILSYPEDCDFLPNTMVFQALPQRDLRQIRMYGR